MSAENTRPLRILINGVYTNAVGHLIEAFMLAMALRRKNPEAEIGVMVNSGAPAELLECVPDIRARWIPVREADYVAEPDPSAIERLVGHDWDFAYALHDEDDISWPARGLIGFQRSFFAWTKVVHLPCANRRKGIELNGCDSRRPFPPAEFGQLKLVLPASARQHAREFFSGRGHPRIMVLPGAATHEKTPPVAFWHRLFAAIRTQFTTSEIVLLGRFGSKHGATFRLTPEDVEALTRDLPRLRHVFDLGIVEQLAVAGECDVLIAPHSGMAFAVQCVGVPWLALSAWKYHEYITNGVPLISIFPECAFYPCHDQTLLPPCAQAISARTGPVECMTDSALQRRIPAILQGLHQLVEERWTYAQCMKSYREKLARIPGRPRRVFENVAAPAA